MILAVIPSMKPYFELPRGYAKTGLVAILFAFSLSVLGAEQGTAQTPRSDVRLIIDISGSMKQNDPENLRIPAVKIVTNLLPKGADAGVWTFGRYVNMLVPLKRVDQAWQEQATLAADKINSAGLYTNMGDALTKSTWDWQRPDSAENRSVILLTDGMVDISKQASENAKERNRILKEILPKLKAAGVTIHTIALSEGADKELLATMANQTDGWFRAVNDAEQLQRVFLKIFEQSTPRDSLPLDNNGFKVDASIEEMTLLVFRKPESTPTELQTPAGTRLSQSSKEKSMRWFAAGSYDLITIENPQEGDWQVIADVDPDNRVMVVSQLGLAVQDLPNNVMANEQIQYEVTLLEEGEPITKPDFLNLVNARLKTDYLGKRNQTPLLKNGNSGSFQQVFFAGEKDGVLDIKLVVKSPTFERSRTHAINIYGVPVSAELEQSADPTTPHYVRLAVVEDVVDLEQLKLNGKITYPDDSNQFISFENWQPVPSIELKPFSEGGKYTVELNVEGQSVSGRSFMAELPLIEFEVAGPEPEPEPEPVQEQPEPQIEEPVVEKPEPQVEVVEPTTEAEPEPQPETDWTLWLSVGLGANLLLGGIGFFVWRRIKKKGAANADALTDSLFDDDLSSGTESDTSDETGENS